MPIRIHPLVISSVVEKSPKRAKPLMGAFISWTSQAAEPRRFLGQAKRRSRAFHALRLVEMTKEGVVEMTVGDCRHDKGMGRAFKKNFKKKRLSQEKVVYSRRE